jgi:hypothetical protein
MRNTLRQQQPLQLSLLEMTKSSGSIHSLVVRSSRGEGAFPLSTYSANLALVFFEGKSHNFSSCFCQQCGQEIFPYNHLHGDYCILRHHERDFRRSFVFVICCYTNSLELFRRSFRVAAVNPINRCVVVVVVTPTHLTFYNFQLVL